MLTICVFALFTECLIDGKLTFKLPINSINCKISAKPVLKHGFPVEEFCCFVSGHDADDDDDDEDEDGGVDDDSSSCLS